MQEDVKIPWDVIIQIDHLIDIVVVDKENGMALPNTYLVFIFLT